MPFLEITQQPGGLQVKDVAPMICGVVDNGVCADDPRVLVRLNEATKIILDTMIPVGGMLTAFIGAVKNEDLAIIVLPPEMENIIEAFPQEGVKVRGSSDIVGGWYEIVNNSVYLDPNQHHDNPLIDIGLIPDPSDASILRRAYIYPGLSNPEAIIVCTGAKRFVPATNFEDYVIVQNVEALKLVIQSIERIENNQTDDGMKIRQAGIQLLEAEVKKHIMDPRMYMRRKNDYQDDAANFPAGTLGWTRANIALDVPDAIKTGKIDLTFSINQAERRIMHNGIYKDMVIDVQANVVGGIVYFPIYVGGVLAVDLDGCPIPIRSQFFEHLENGPGMYACSHLLKDLGDEYFPATKTFRRKYKLIADCHNVSCLNAVCMVRWMEKKAEDMMTIKNYEAIRLMVAAKFLEEGQKFNEAQANQQQAMAIMDRELKQYLAGIRHTVHIQTYGFGLSDVGNYWSR